MTSQLPGTHQASAPASRFWPRPGTSPSSVTTPSATRISIAPLADGGSLTISGWPLTQRRMRQFASAGSSTRASRTWSPIMPSSIGCAGRTCSRSMIGRGATTAAAARNARRLTETSATSPSTRRAPLDSANTIEASSNPMRVSARSVSRTRFKRSVSAVIRQIHHRPGDVGAPQRPHRERRQAGLDLDLLLLPLRLCRFR